MPEITNSILPSNIKYYPQLDGLRGIAILMVMAFHYFPGASEFRFGWAGVDLFFVLSGFLISSRLIPFINEKKILLKFYRNRFLRILPLYFAFLLSFFFVWFCIASKTSIKQNPFYSNYWWAFFLFIQNWVYIFNPQQSIDYLNHFWSLAAEEQFYIIFPFFVLLFRKPKRVLIGATSLAFIILFSRVIYFNYFNPNHSYQIIYWNSFFRADSFLIGCILFVLTKYYADKKKYFIFYRYAFMLSFILLIGGIYYYKSMLMSNPFFETIGYTLISVTFSYLLLKSIENKNKILEGITSNSLLKFCGKISYGLYVFHWPVYLAGYAIINKILKNNYSISVTNLHLLNVTFSIILTFTICHLSFKYFEAYFLKLKAK